MKKKMMLSEDRPAATIQVKIPDVKGMADCQPLIRFYVGQGLRKDLAELRKRTSPRDAKKVPEKYNADPRVTDEVMAAMT